MEATKASELPNTSNDVDLDLGDDINSDLVQMGDYNKKVQNEIEEDKLPKDNVEEDENDEGNDNMLNNDNEINNIKNLLKIIENIIENNVNDREDIYLKFYYHLNKLMYIKINIINNNKFNGIKTNLDTWKRDNRYW